jgi:hypothetical protein
MWSWSSLAGMATHWHVGAALLNLSWTRYACTCRKMGELDVYPLQFTLVRHQPVTRGRAGRGKLPVTCGTNAGPTRHICRPSTSRPSTDRASGQKEVLMSITTTADRRRRGAGAVLNR